MSKETFDQSVQEQAQQDKLAALAGAGITDVTDKGVADAVRASAEHLNRVVAAAHKNGLRINYETAQTTGGLFRLIPTVVRPL